jgi:diadenosine tetraphosphate (Ap4A) HIT family hydrolase
MFDSACIFCKIIQGSIPSTIIKENEHVMVIKNIAPKAPVHYLIIPKRHIADVAALTDADQPFGWYMLKIAGEISKEENLSGFNLVANNGQSAGQSVFHLHFHFIAGKNLYSGGFTL